MYNLDLASLLKEALVIGGCTDQQVGSFDAHSTIELELENLPSVYIGIVDEELWLWSTLIEASDMLLAHRSEGLLRFLMQGFAFARTEQMQLTDSDGMLSVRVLLADAAFASAEAFSDTLEGYVAALMTLFELVHK